jgi:hypothetical protein
VQRSWDGIIADLPGPPASIVHERDSIVTRSNILYLIVGALVIVVAVLGYQLYQDRKQPEGSMHIDVGPNGLSIEKK